MKILLIEPDKLLQRQYSEALEAAGHKVAVVGDAQAGIIAADKTSPELVIVEPLLASHSGMEFLYEFRSYGEWQKIPVIILSRIESSDLGLSNNLMSNLNIVKALYKPNISLNKLVETVKGI